MTEDKATAKKAVKEEAAKEEDNLITLSTGVVLRGKAAPSLALVKVIAKHVRPKPPEIKSEALGRIIENGADPDYLQRVKAYETESAHDVLNVLILYGTEVVSVPKGFPTVKSNTWLEEIRAIGLEVEPDNESWRYLNWIMFKAAPSPEDTQKIQEVVGSLSGVTERAVQAAEDFSGSQ